MEVYKKNGLIFLTAVWACVLSVVCVPIVALAQGAETLPVAVTLSVSGATGAGGELVAYDEDSGRYSISRTPDQDGVIGVSVERPPLLFATANNTTPVATGGTVYARVSDTSGPVQRGDLLVSGTEPGTAVKATLENDQVFALALEDMTGVGGTELLLVQFDPPAAKQLQKDRQAADAEEGGGLLGVLTGSEGEGSEGEERGLVRTLLEDYVRIVVAALIAVGALLFVLRTFRVTITNATLSVGRNPRAKSAIMLVSLGNLLFTLIICAVAFFVAIGVLVLPV